MMKEINVRVEVPTGKMDEYRQRREWETKVKEAKDAVKAYLESTGDPIVSSFRSASPCKLCWMVTTKHKVGSDESDLCVMCIFITRKIFDMEGVFTEYDLVSKYEDGTLVPELMEMRRGMQEQITRYAKSLEKRIETLEKGG